MWNCHKLWWILWWTQAWTDEAVLEHTERKMSPRATALHVESQAEWQTLWVDGPVISATHPGLWVVFLSYLLSNMSCATVCSLHVFTNSYYHFSVMSELTSVRNHIRNRASVIAAALMCLCMGGSSQLHENSKKVQQYRNSLTFVFLLKMGLLLCCVC